MGEEGASELHLGAQPFDLDFHPSAQLVAVGLITGKLLLEVIFRLDRYNSGAEGEPQQPWDVSAHTESCRGVRFIEGGRYVLTASADKSILATDSETGQPVARLPNAHAVVSILPNKMIGVVGEHADYPIERLAFSNDRTVLGSASHDHCKDASLDAPVETLTPTPVSMVDSDQDTENEKPGSKKKKKGSNP